MVFLSSAGQKAFNPDGMEPEIRPEPTPEEREAIDAALARLVAEPLLPGSKWWREGVREAIMGEEEPA
jgi:hypothetical protein